MSKFRGFIAVDITPNPNINKLHNEIKQTGADVKLVEPQNIHITLKFLGDVEENHIDQIEQIIKDSIDNIAPFTIKLKGTGVFPNENYIKVIWIGLEEAEKIAIIATTLDEGLSKLGFKKEKRAFSPHLTIGRVKTAKNKQELLRIINTKENVEFSEQNIHSITLKKSVLTPKGPIYTTIKEVIF